MRRTGTRRSSDGHEPAICIPKIGAASTIRITSERKPVNTAVMPCAMATAPAVTGVTRRRRSRPISRCCTSGSATPNKAPDISVVVSSPGISTARHARVAARHHEAEQHQEPERERHHPEERGLRPPKLGELGARRARERFDEHVRPDHGTQKGAHRVTTSVRSAAGRRLRATGRLSRRSSSRAPEARSESARPTMAAVGSAVR